MKTILQSLIVIFIRINERLPKYGMSTGLYLLAILSISAQQDPSENRNDHLSMHINFHPDSTLTVTATYSIAEIKNNEVFFLLNPGYPIESIKSSGLKNHELVMKQNRPFPFYKLNFEKEPKIGDSLQVAFKYTIDLKTSNHITSNWLEFNVDQLWFPKYDDLDTEFTYDVQIENFYEDYSLVTYTYQDIIRSQTFMDPPSKIELTQEKPTPEIYLMMAKDMVLWKNSNRKNTVPIQFFAHGDLSEEILISMDEKLQTIIQFFNERYGKPMPIENYLVVLRNTNNISFLQSRGEILLGNAYSDNFAALSHEVGHYWWSFADFLREPWMNEAFANYSMFLILDAFDKQALSQQLSRSTKYAAQAGSVRNAGTFPPSNINSYYHKGSLLLWELEQKIGRDAFLKLLTKRVSDKVHDTQGFLNLLKLQEGSQVCMEFESKL